MPGEEAADGEGEDLVAGGVDADALGEKSVCLMLRKVRPIRECSTA